MAHFGANSVVYFKRNVRLFTVTIYHNSYCRLLAADGVPLNGEGPKKIFGLLHLKWLISVPIQFHFNRIGLRSVLRSRHNTVWVIWETVFTGQKTQPTVSKY